MLWKQMELSKMIVHERHEKHEKVKIVVAIIFAKSKALPNAFPRGERLWKNSPRRHEDQK